MRVRVYVRMCIVRTYGTCYKKPEYVVCECVCVCVCVCACVHVSSCTYTHTYVCTVCMISQVPTQAMYMHTHDRQCLYFSTGTPEGV